MVINCKVMASNAPKTLKRWRPLGAGMKTRAKHHKKPKKGCKTKWAASTKKTLR
jgi:hypothetical protein